MSCLRRLSFVAVVALVGAAGCAATPEVSASAEGEESAHDESALEFIPIPIQSCKTVSPHWAVVMSATMTGVTRASNGNEYGQGFCDRFVLEVYLSPTATVPAGYTRSIDREGHGTVVDADAWTLPYAPGSAECADYREDLTVWGNGVNVGGGTRHGITRLGHLAPTGQWIPARCVLADSDTFVPVAYATTPQPNQFHTIHRIAIKAYKASTGEKLPVVASVLRQHL
jgi:hypothetical protein